MNRPRTKLRETRYVDLEDVEIRSAEDDGHPIIDGYAIRYSRWSQDLGGFRERIMPGACARTIAEADIRALFNHDPNYVLGRNRSATLELTEDAKGLRNVIHAPTTDLIRDLVIEPMRRKDITQQSFAFRIPERMSDSKEPAQVWRAPDDPEIVKKDGLWERDIFEVRLYDVSIVTYPAYTDATAKVRSIGELDGVGIDWAALTAAITRGERGIPLTDTDRDLFAGTIAVLRAYVEPEPAPEPVSDDAATTRDGTPNADRPTAGHLLRLLELELATA